MLNELFRPDIVQNLDYRILSTIVSLLALSLIFFALGIKRFCRGKILSASVQSLSGLSLFLASLLCLSIAVNFYSYDRLTFEQAVAKLTIKQLDKQQFQVDILFEKESKNETYTINGDEWQIDARVIKWHGWAQILGLNAQYRLERISGRYIDIDEEREKSRSVYALGNKDEIDYWKLIHKHKEWLPWVDAYYGSATYLPMSDNSAYLVSLTQSGLIARPLKSNSETNLDNKTDESLKFW